MTEVSSTMNRVELLHFVEAATRARKVMTTKVPRLSSVAPQVVSLGNRHSNGGKSEEKGGEARGHSYKERRPRTLGERTRLSPPP